MFKFNKELGITPDVFVNLSQDIIDAFIVIMSELDKKTKRKQKEQELKSKKGKMKKRG